MKGAVKTGLLLVLTVIVLFGFNFILSAIAPEYIIGNTKLTIDVNKAYINGRIYTPNCAADCHLPVNISVNKSYIIPDTSKFRNEFKDRLGNINFNNVISYGFDLLQQESYSIRNDNCSVVISLSPNGTSGGRSVCYPYDTTASRMAWKPFNPVGKTLNANQVYTVDFWFNKKVALGSNNDLDNKIYIAGQDVDLAWGNGTYNKRLNATFYDMRGGIATGEIMPVHVNFTGLSPALAYNYEGRILNQSGISIPYNISSNTSTSIDVRFNLTWTGNGSTVGFYYNPSVAVEPYTESFSNQNFTANWQAYHENNTNTSSFFGSAALNAYGVPTCPTYDYTSHHTGGYVEVNQTMLYAIPANARYIGYSVLALAQSGAGTEDVYYNNVFIGTISKPAGYANLLTRIGDTDFVADIRHSCNGGGDSEWNMTVYVPKTQFKNGASLKFQKGVTAWMYGFAKSDPPVNGAITWKFGTSPYNEWILNESFGTSETAPAITPTTAVPAVLQISNGTFTMNSSGLVGYWRFEQSNGSAATNDSSGYGNMGTLTNMNLTGNASSGITQGRFGNALLFDGVNDYVDAGSASNLNATNNISTISVWFKTNTDATQPIVAKGITGVTGTGRSIYITGGPVVRVYTFDNAGNRHYPATGIINLNTWYNFALVLNGTHILGYLNGLQLTGGFPEAMIGYSESSNNLTVGGYVGNYFNGAIDEVQIWNRSLSADEINMLYSNQATYNDGKIFFGNSSNTSLSINMYSNNTLLGSGGTWNFTPASGYQYLLVNTSGDSAYNRSEFMIPLNISRANLNGNLYINRTQASQIWTYPNATNATGTTGIRVNNDGILYLFRNETSTGTLIGSNFISVHELLGVGIYNYTTAWIGSNYTFANITYSLTITQQTPILNLTINNTEADLSVYYPAITNATTYTNLNGFNNNSLNLYRNGSLVSTGSQFLEIIVQPNRTVSLSNSSAFTSPLNLNDTSWSTSTNMVDVGWNWFYENYTLPSGNPANLVYYVTKQRADATGLLSVIADYYSIGGEWINFLTASISQTSVDVDRNISKLIPINNATLNGNLLLVRQNISTTIASGTRYIYENAINYSSTTSFSDTGTLPVGIYNYTANVTATANYTTATKSYILTVLEPSYLQINSYFANGTANSWYLWNLTIDNGTQRNFSNVLGASTKIYIKAANMPLNNVTITMSAFKMANFTNNTLGNILINTTSLNYTNNAILNATFWPMQYFSAKDINNNQILYTFTANLTNATTLYYNASTTGSFEVPLYNLPFGSVTGTFIMSGYNNTLKNYAITADSSLNETIYMSFASLTVHAYDELNTSSQLYFTIDISNSTNTESNGSALSYYKRWNESILGDDTLTVGNTTYVSRNYYVTVSSTNAISLNAYLLANSEAVQRRFLVINQAGSPVPNAKITIQRLLNNTYIAVVQSITDSAGNGYAFLQSGTSYKIITTHNSYSTNTQTIDATSDVYTITLSVSVLSNLTMPWGGISYNFTPYYNSINATNQTFTCDVFSSAGDLSLVGFNISLNGTWTLYNSEITTSPTGAGFSTTQDFSYANRSNGYVMGNCYFTKTGFGQYNGIRKFYVYDITITNSSLPFFFGQIAQTFGLGKLALAIISLLITGLTAGFINKFNPAFASITALLVLSFFTVFMNWFDVYIFMFVTMGVIAYWFVRREM